MDCMEPKCDPKSLECIHATLLQSCTFTSISGSESDGNGQDLCSWAWAQHRDAVSRMPTINSLFDNHFLRHDFHPSHGGNGNPGSNVRGCEGEGLMSYGSKEHTRAKSKRPNAWSTCSNSDFKNWFKTRGYQCLNEGAPPAGLPTAAPTTLPQSAPPGAPLPASLSQFGSVWISLVQLS